MSVAEFYDGYDTWLGKSPLVRSQKDQLGALLEHRTNLLDFHNGPGKAPAPSQSDGKRGMHFPIGHCYYCIRRETDELTKESFIASAKGAVRFLSRGHGIVSTFLDNAVGLLTNTYAFTVTLDIKFIETVPVNVDLVIKSKLTNSQVTKSGATKIFVQGEIQHPSTLNVLAHAKALFIKPPPSKQIWKKELNSICTPQVERALLTRMERVNFLQRDLDQLQGRLQFRVTPKRLQAEIDRIATLESIESSSVVPCVFSQGKLAVFHLAEKDFLVYFFVCSEGPPGIAHGGAIATAMLLAATAHWQRHLDAAGIGGMRVEPTGIGINYTSSVNLEQVHRVRATFLQSTLPLPHKCSVRVEILQGDALCSSAQVDLRAATTGSKI